MSKITIMATFRVDDNIITKERLIDSLMCESFRGLKIMPDDAELYQEDPIYREKVAEYNKIKKKKEEYLKIKLQENHK